MNAIAGNAGNILPTLFIFNPRYKRYPSENKHQNTLKLIKETVGCTEIVFTEKDGVWNPVPELTITRRIS
jgi:hypothetical protein